MSCIILVGGIIGCGKTKLLNFIHERENEIFQALSFETDVNLSKCNSNKEELSNQRKIFRITFDDLCSIQDQAELMKTVKGWRNFGVDLFMAVEHFISLICRTELRMYGPLTERSQNLLERVVNLNNGITTECIGLFFVEDNFYYRSMRYEWLQIARRANIGFCEVFLQCPLSTVLYRNSSRGYQIPEQKVKMMASIIEYPDPEKYKWEKYSILYDSLTVLEFSALKEILEVIKMAACNPSELMMTEQKVEAQNICSKNVVHQADKILRKIITKKVSYIKENTSQHEDLKSCISIANDIRQEVLQDIRQGQVQLSKDMFLSLTETGIESVRTEYEKCVSSLFENLWEQRTGDMSLLLTNLKIKGS